DTSIPGCCLCLTRQLYHIACGVVPPHGWKERTLEITLCWGFPTLCNIIPDYVAQSHRFDLLENVGCWPAVYYSWPSLIILTLSRLLPAVVALIYSVLAVFNLCRRRLALRSMLAKSRSECSISLFQLIRLMVMVLFLGAYHVVFISLPLIPNHIIDDIEPWINWSFVHADFSFVGQYTQMDLSQQDFLWIYAGWSFIPLTGLIFFALFGMGEEARRDYVSCWKLAIGRFCRTPPLPPIRTAHSWDMPTLQPTYILLSLERIPTFTLDV
ncbi:GPCR fungal pheromone mating factor, partial [Mycena capillaripes]